MLDKNLVRLQMWIPRQERDAFKQWCNERNASLNTVLRTLVRERMSTTRTAVPTPSGARPRRDQMTLAQATRQVEKALIRELAMEADPVLSIKMRPVLDRLKRSFGI